MTSVADARFLLPAPADHADALGESRLAETLAAHVPAATPSLLAVADARSTNEAAGRDYELLLLEGAASTRLLAARGYTARRYLSLPSVAQPSLLIPAAGGAVGAYALGNWTFPRTKLRRLRNRGVRTLLARGLRPPFAPVVTVAARQDGLPFLVRAAADLRLVAPNVAFFVRSGGLDELSRSTFFLFEADAVRPRWLLKFARVRDYSAPFDLDERGLALVGAAPEEVRRHAPRLVGRLEVDGIHASVETAAVGRPLADELRRPGDRGAQLALVDAVARWILALGRASRRDDRFELERARLAALVADCHDDPRVPPGLSAQLPTLPTVLQHNDIGCWNVITDDDSFVVVDWESAHAHGLPLWDLWYFLLDALAAIDGAAPDRREAYFAALFRGELATSSILFRWTCRAVEELRIPPDAVAAIATLCWLHHGRSHVRREDARRLHAPPASGPAPNLFPYARVWLTDRQLGAAWSRWRA